MIRSIRSLIIVFVILGVAGLAISAASSKIDSASANTSITDIAAIDIFPGMATLAILIGGSLPLLLFRRRKRAME